MKFIHTKKKGYYKSISRVSKMFLMLHYIYNVTQNIEIVQTQDLISWRFRLPCNFLTN